VVNFLFFMMMILLLGGQCASARHVIQLEAPRFVYGNPLKVYCRDHPYRCGDPPPNNTVLPGALKLPYFPYTIRIRGGGGRRSKPLSNIMNVAVWL